MWHVACSKYERRRKINSEVSAVQDNLLFSLRNSYLLFQTRQWLYIFITHYYIHRIETRSWNTICYCLVLKPSYCSGWIIYVDVCISLWMQFLIVGVIDLLLRLKSLLYIYWFWRKRYFWTEATRLLIATSCYQSQLSRTTSYSSCLYTWWHFVRENQVNKMT